VPLTEMPILIISRAEALPNEAIALDRAVGQANIIKSTGTRIITLAIGDDLDINNLIAISGPNVAENAGEISTETDVIKTGFDTLADTLATLASELCAGKILIQKQIDLDGDGQIDLDGSVNNQELVGWQFTVDGETQQTGLSGYLEFPVDTPATYSATENVKGGFVMTGAECVIGSEPVGSFNGVDGVTDIAIGHEETVSCNFYNQVKTGEITVIKNVIGGNAASADWTMHIQQGGEDMVSPFAGSASGVAKTVRIGNYQVTESGGPAGYSLTYGGDCDQNGNITVAYGEEKTCILNNTIDTGSLKVKKIVDLGDTHPDQWSLLLLGLVLYNRLRELIT